MNTPPIGPSTPSQPTFGGVPAGDQAQQNISQILDVAQQLQHAIASGDQTQVMELLKELEKPLHDLQKIAHQLSAEQRKLAKHAFSDHMTLSDKDNASPTDIAMFQGTCNTLHQILSSPTSHPNAQALLATNHLAGLANAIQTHLNASNGNTHLPECQDLIDGLNAPCDQLENLLQTGQLNSEQSEIASAIVEHNKASFQTPDSQGDKTASPEALNALQRQISDLNDALLR